MFSIGLEFSLPQLKAMRRAVFGLGLAQVAITTVAAMVALHFVGYGWQAGFALGGMLAMSSTAIVSKMLAERMELATPHGRDVMGILLFQDLAVVAFLIVIPSLGKGGGELMGEVGVATLKAAVVLAVILFAGQAPMRAWFHIVARQKSSELFMLNLLLVTLGLAALTELAGLSLALGAFLAGMLIAETEYRYQVEEDIKPFRDVLLGLFFVTVGMFLDLRVVATHWIYVLVLLVLPVAAKLVLVVILSRAVRRAARQRAADRLLPRAGGRVRAGDARARGGEQGPRPAAHAGGAGGDGAVDARGAARHPLRRAGRAQAHRERLARARGADHADRRDDDGAAGPRDHLRLRSERAEPRAAPRGRGHSVHRARLGPGARARGGRRGQQRGVRRRRAQGRALRRRSLEGARGRHHVRGHDGGAQDPASCAPDAPRAAGRRAHARRHASSTGC